MKTTKWVIEYHERKAKTLTHIAYGDANAQAFKDVASIKGWVILSITAE